MLARVPRQCCCWSLQLFATGPISRTDSVDCINLLDIIEKYLLPGHEVVKCTLLDHAVCISKLLKLFEYRNRIF